ncbi:hypothetical protein [Arthrobacter sp. 35W]|uniref:hypothetical protein n=1 Tax=Arthrobacter sp. 35W TaxID=1132441 RepID=UPI0004098A72|nr:hypothetical protein [Arthrobacter sp. 35W]
MNAAVLLEGPRGRRLCLELAMELDPRIRAAVFGLAYSLDPGAGTSRVVLSAVGGAAPEPPAAPPPEQLAAALAALEAPHLDEGQMLAALKRSVDTARYWQEPEGEDVLADLPSIRAALHPLAERIMSASTMQWLAEPSQERQWSIDWRPAADPAPLPKDARTTLARWADKERAEEVRAARQRPRDPRANFSGSWWSIPHGVLQSVGRIPAGLGLVEDSLGWEQATTIPVRGAGRIFEIRTADDWTFLCRTYPLEVTASRRHDWFRATGRDGRWVVPDWDRVAGEWDAAHLTGLGYLGCAARALPVDADTASIIAGWNPDTTIWFTDAAREGGGPRQGWHRPPTEDSWILES